MLLKFCPCRGFTIFRFVSCYFRKINKMDISGYKPYTNILSESDNKCRAKSFLIPNKNTEKHIACTWRKGNKFTIYPRSQKTGPPPSQNCNEAQIMKIRQDILLFNPILRKLVNESNGTFLALQKAAESSKISDNQVEFLKLSRQYRSIVRVCIESLQETSEKITDGLQKNAIHAYVTIFYSIECIWHLCEILYIDNVPGEVVLPFLLEWVRFHFPGHEQTAAGLLEACERGSEDHKDYWDTVIGMIVQGRVDVARALLKLHSESESSEFKLIDVVLRSMPVYSAYGSISTDDFKVTWKYWQNECRSKQQSKIFAAQPKLDLIVKLISGDYATFSSIRSNYSSWFDILGGWVMFTTPWSKRRELSAAASACAGMGTNPRAPLDDMVRALLDGDLHQVIHEVQQISDNGWFASHLTDMLYHCGKLKILDKQQNDITNRLRESLILEYGSLLMEHKSLWPVGLSYLVSCPPEGLRRAELLLERIRPDTEAKAMRIIAEAKKYGIHDVVSTVCRSLSARHVTSGRVGAAAAWAGRGGGGAPAARAAHAALKDYIQTGVLPAADLLLTAGPMLLLDETLLFLGKYCEFHRMYKNREFKKAAELLVSLIDSQIAPDYFWDTLLLDTLPLLECDVPVFSSVNTCSIMTCLELKNTTLDEEKSSLLRLALARNLARVALTEVPKDKAE